MLQTKLIGRYEGMKGFGKAVAFLFIVALSGWVLYLSVSMG
jgi:hypothetical protein